MQFVIEYKSSVGFYTLVGTIFNAIRPIYSELRYFEQSKSSFDKILLVVVAT